jgi:hypothetical protein
MQVAQSFSLTSWARSHQQSPRLVQQVQSFSQTSMLFQSHQESIPLQLGVISRLTYPNQEGPLLKVAQDYERISSARHVHLFCVRPCAVKHELRDDHQPFVRFSFQKVFSRLVDVLSSSLRVYARFSFQKAWAGVSSKISYVRLYVMPYGPIYVTHYASARFYFQMAS